MVYGIIFEKLSLGQDGPIDWGKMGTAHLAPCYSAAHKSGESTKKEKNKKVSKPAKKKPVRKRSAYKTIVAHLLL